jgi:hypothetical protein
MPVEMKGWMLALLLAIAFGVGFLAGSAAT